MIRAKERSTSTVLGESREGNSNFNLMYSNGISIRQEDFVLLKKKNLLILFEFTPIVHLPIPPHG